MNIPLVLVNLNSAYNSVEVLCGLIDHLLLTIDILVGADVDCRGVCEPIDSCVVTRTQTKSLIELEKGLLGKKDEVTHNPSDFYESELNLEDLFEENLLESVVDFHVDESCEVAQNCVCDGVVQESMTLNLPTQSVVFP